MGRSRSPRKGTGQRGKGRRQGKAREKGEGREGEEGTGKGKGQSRIFRK